MNDRQSTTYADVFVGLLCPDERALEGRDRRVSRAGLEHAPHVEVDRVRDARKEAAGHSLGRGGAGEPVVREGLVRASLDLLYKVRRVLRHGPVVVVVDVLLDDAGVPGLRLCELD